VSIADLCAAVRGAFIPAVRGHSLCGSPVTVTAFQHQPGHSLTPDVTAEAILEVTTGACESSGEGEQAHKAWPGLKAKCLFGGRSFAFILTHDTWHTANGAFFAYLRDM